MATFLDLVQGAERDSGTMPSLAATTVGQTGRHGRFVYWVREAYHRIQRTRSDWRWLRTRFSGSTVAGLREHDAGLMGIASRFRSWLHEGRERDLTISSASSQEDEGALTLVPWSYFEDTFLFGTAASDAGRPTHVAIDPQNRLCFYPLPDDAYTIRGRYLKGAQTLTADDDIPEMPEDYHDMVKWQALQLMAIFDEAFAQEPHWQREYETLKTALLAEQTGGDTRITWGEALA